MRILFVDDEQNVLQGLRRSLRSMRKQWSMDFVDSGKEALRMIAQAQEPYQVIVSDMRMPGMDGSELLNIVRQNYPSMLRFALSGGTDENITFKTTHVAHQFLSKPCETEMLKSVLGGSKAIIDLMKNNQLRNILTKLSTVPSMPDVMVELNREINTEEPSLKKIGVTIGQDIGMTAKILQLVNSAFFGVPHKVTSPEQAATMLGLDTVKALVLTVGIFNTFEPDLFPEMKSEQMFSHGHAVGRMARDLCKLQGLDESSTESALLAGMLHDIGKIVLAAYAPSHYREVLDLVQSGESIYKAEKEIFEVTHAECGAYVLGTWGLPGDVVKAIALHHQPGKCDDVEPGLIAAVHFANWAYHDIFTKDADIIDKYDDSFMKPFYGTDTIDTWKQICQKAVQKETNPNG